MLSLVIPCYNESGNIPLIFERLRPMLDAHAALEVLLVNNGSKDDSAQVMAAAQAALGNLRLRIVDVPVNQGYGHGILAGLAEAKGTALAWTHADMQTDPQDVMAAYARYQDAGNANIIVKGKRRNRAWAEVAFTFGMQLVASAALRMRLDDINAQPKLFSREFYETLLRPNAPKDFSLDLFLLYQARLHGYRILTVPVIFAKRLHGEAKGGGSFKTRIKLIRRTFSYIFQLRRTVRAGR